MNPSSKRILVVKLAAIGDVTLALPFFAALKEEFSQSHVALLVGKSAAPLAENNPAIDQHIVIDENIFWRKRMPGLVSLFWRLKRENFDAVYILHWSRWFHAFFWFMGIPERIGFNRNGRSFRLTRAAPYVEGSQDIHETQQYLRLVHERYAHDNPAAHAPKLFFSEEEKTGISKWIASLGFPTDRPWIAVSPGGGHNTKLFMPQKRWPAAHYAGLLKRLLAEEKAYIFLLGDSSEKNLIKPWMDQMPSRDYCNLAGEISLRRTALLIQRCRLFIGNDSGLLHLAGAVGTPSLSFFGPTSPNGKLPVWTLHKYLYTREICSPCYKYGQAPPCPYDLKCLRHITVDEAFREAHELLGQKEAVG